jgi:hypothetical protein
MSGGEGQRPDTPMCQLLDILEFASQRCCKEDAACACRKAVFPSKLIISRSKWLAKANSSQTLASFTTGAYISP